MQCVIIIAFLCLLFVQVSEGITTHSVTGFSDDVPLNCSNYEMIHVERITYYKETGCSLAVTDLEVCGQPLTGSDTGLVPACNGKTICRENLYNTCPLSKAAKVDYRCIPGNDVKDMCDEFIIENTNRIFLSTPNYPLTPNFTGISPCRCSIRGSSISSIQILELELQASNNGTNSSLEINRGETKSIDALFNERLSTASRTAEIILNHNNVNEQYLWIEIQGVSMRVFCNDDSHGISSTLSSTLAPTATSSSPSTRPTQVTTSKESSQDKDTTIIILAVLFSLCLLIISITAVIIIVLLRRKKLVWVDGSESNSYSGLDRTQRVSGSDGTYQELNTRNSTVQYYNTSQNTHHDYQHVS